MQLCERQLRSDVNGPYALDLPAVALVAQSLDVDVAMTIEVAADIEPYIVFAWRPRT